LISAVPHLITTVFNTLQSYLAITMVDTTINYNPNTVSIQEISVNNDKNYETLSVRKAAEIFSSVAKDNINALRKNKITINNDEKSGLYD
jgi:hypothetical protein